VSVTAVSDAAAVLEAIDALAPSLAARAAATEANGTLPADVVDDLREAGVFRLLLPTSHGGAEADLPTAMRAIAALARADGSVGWTSAIGSGAWCDMATLPRTTFDQIFADPGTIVAAAFAPGGTIEPVDGGYRVTGRWGFASGIRHATVLYANAVERGPAGEMHMRAAVLDPEQITLEHTWEVSGLRGTGSEHFHVDGLVVPATRTFVPLVGVPCVDTPIVRVSTPSIVGFMLASVAVGIARGALDDLGAMAGSKVPLLASGPLAADPLFCHDLAVAATDLRAAEVLLRDTADTSWTAAADGRLPAVSERAEQRAASAWATMRAASVVDAAYRLAGGSAVYAEGSLQRRWRDVHAVTQHFVLKDGTFTACGSVLVGGDPGVPVF
jgi:alkylation response protein AidB-like acyl-CoA dehydrogenase